MPTSTTEVSTTSGSGKLPFNAMAKTFISEVSLLTTSKPRSVNESSRVIPTTTATHHRGSYDAAKLSCCDRGTLQCYRLCRTAHTSEFFSESDELDKCVAQPSQASVATCFEDGINVFTCSY